MEIDDLFEKRKRIKDRISEFQEDEDLYEYDSNYQYQLQQLEEINEEIKETLDNER